mgnify:CR=1 FL=1
MSENIILKEDVDFDVIVNKKIAIIGYGNQGRAQALNLRDSGLNVRVALRKNSKTIQAALNDKFSVLDIKDALIWADIISVLLPDKVAPKVFREYFDDSIIRSKTILFSHGYNIHYEFILPPVDVNIIMVAPSSGGQVLRDEYKKNYGVPALIAINQDFTKDAYEIAKAYAQGIGSMRVCVFKSTFKEETETDIFGEQAILTGGLPFLINSAFNTLIKNGYSPTTAWFVCYYEVKTIVDLFHKKGFSDFYQMISDTARYGGLSKGRTLIDPDFENKLQSILEDIQSGKFNNELSMSVDNKNLPEYFSEIEKQTMKLLKHIKK